MRIAVTGSAGFTGRYLIEALRKQGHEPVPLAADLTDAPALRREVAAAAPDAAIHLAALSFVHLDDFDAFYRVNQIGTFNLLAALAETRPGITVLLASSAQVYGDDATGLIDEDHSLSAANHYGLSKLAMEMGARFWADRLRLLIARPFNYTGRGQEERFLIPKIVAHFRRRERSIELGNIDVQRDFGDVRSVVSAYCDLLVAETAETIFNVCSQRLCSVRDVLAIAAAATGHEISVEINPAFVRINDVAVLGGSNQRLRTALPGWDPYPIEDTILWMLDAEGGTVSTDAASPTSGD